MPNSNAASAARAAKAISVINSRAKQVDEQDISIVEAGSLDFSPLEIEQRSVPQLSYGLDRVLFNPGVYHLQDPRSRVTTLIRTCKRLCL